MKRKGGNKINRKQHQKKKASTSKDGEEELKRKGSLTDISLTSSSNSSIDSDEISSFGSDSKDTMTSSESLSPQQGENGDAIDTAIQTDSKNSRSRTRKKKQNKQGKKEELAQQDNGRDSYRFTANSGALTTDQSLAQTLFTALTNRSQNKHNSGGENSRPKIVINAKEKLKAKVGFGIAASGIYDTVPVMHGVRHDQAGASNGVGYTEMVGEDRINWRTEFDESMQSEAQMYSAINIDWDSVMTHRVDLSQAITRATDNKWIRGFLRNILDGNLKKFWKGLHTIMYVIVTQRGQKYQDDSRNELFEHFVMQIVSMLVGDDGFNVIMHLLTNETPGIRHKSPCYEAQHKYCVMAELILYLLPPARSQSLLASQTTNARRRAAHFAALAGSPCQLDVLLRFGIDPNDSDVQKQCPLHYALIRNNVTMARQLMWHGTDLASFFSRVHMNKCFQFYSTRMDSLEKTMASWVKALCAGKYKVEEAVTDLHISRLALLNDYQYVVGTSTGITGGHTRKVKLVPKPSLYRLLRESDNMLILMMLPVFYTPNDAIMPAQNPHICRVKLVEDLTGLPARVIPNDPSLCYQRHDRRVDKVLSTGFVEKHNGFYYGWHLPKDIELRAGGQPIMLNFTVDTAELTIEVSDHCLFFIQGFSVFNSHTVVKEKSD